jgi:alkylation response protein AidB-like acyl-CoA dehydrogenase
MHNLQLTDDQTLILDTVTKFVADAVAPHAQERDEHRTFARDEFAGLAELGLFAMPIPEDRGGAGMGLLPFAASCEAIGAQSGSLARLLVSQTQCAAALAHAGSDAMESVATGAKVAAWIGAEHGITATGGKLAGKAELVPAAGEAELLVVVAKDGSKTVLAVVDAQAAKRTALRALGFASAAPSRVEFAATAATIVCEGADADAACALAERIAMIGSAAACVGGGRASIAGAHKHASERIAFGKPLLGQEAVARKLVESRRAVDAARHLAWHAARICDLGEDAEAACLQARIAAVDAAVLASDEAIQIHGGFGYTVEYHVERHYRDAKATEVIDGGNERCKSRLAALQFNS